MIYPADSVIHLSNNWGQKYKWVLTIHVMAPCQNVAREARCNKQASSSEGVSIPLIGLIGILGIGVELKWATIVVQTFLENDAFGNLSTYSILFASSINSLISPIPQFNVMWVLWSGQSINIVGGQGGRGGGNVSKTLEN